VDRIARAFLLAMFCFMSGGLMLSSGESLLTTALVLTGFMAILGGANGVVLRNMARQGKSNIFQDFPGLAGLERREWAQLAIFLIVGIGLLAAGFLSAGA
jgi:hypothetical protein